MIKFFRKIRQKLLTQNPADGQAGRLGRYLLYAVGEIILVVIGILIALSINNWNQNRIDGRKESLLLKEINAEFKYNKEELESTVRTYNLILNECDLLIKLFPINQNEINKDTLSIALELIRNTISADLSMGSISTLINTSSFEIISNNELRTLLIQWEDLISDYFEREEQAINYTRQTITPYLATRLPRPYKRGLDDERVDLSFLTSIEFENLINDRRRDVNVLLNIVKDEDTEIRKAIDRIILLSESSND
ncbi:hypothetical protein [Fulvivirga sedimenti]|uniref:Uncharacterized protein n=1 Tax=Fulvivirga sedimenti TaxID=2879465 RepID=A0A9X1L0T4_9BACT|nr:hypothetical protein [Fulvivirga sedimenti]MCA6075024.1 hypothetical protein [Fulvivirga sedimenti]MCA6076201.1 hypothetical protein [Fulvivirga sedimenti]MCA6077329.1 hypothetical protein [Fulvivirga sedimenti]